MSETKQSRLAWVFVGLIGIAALTLFSAGGPVGASGDHDEAHELRRSGDVMPLAQLLEQADLGGLRIIEADLEREHGTLVYELELLDDTGRVHKRHFDAVSGSPLARSADD